ncbi:MAG: hypothetical protein AB8E15_12420 [Bdellovibrionales bacterium]
MKFIFLNLVLFASLGLSAEVDNKLELIPGIYTGTLESNGDSCKIEISINANEECNVPNCVYDMSFFKGSELKDEFRFYSGYTKVQESGLYVSLDKPYPWGGAKQNYLALLFQSGSLDKVEYTNSSHTGWFKDSVSLCELDSPIEYVIW